MSGIVGSYFNTRGSGIVAKGTGVIQITSTMNPTITSTGKALVMGF